VAWLEDDGVRGHVVLVVVEFRQGADDGGDQVGATTDWFGQQHVGAFVDGKLLDGAGEFVEVTAEAGPGDFSHAEAVRAEGLRVDEIGGLIVSDDADLLALVLIHLRKSGDGGGFARAEEAPDHHVFDGFTHPSRSSWDEGEILPSRYRRADRCAMRGVYLEEAVSTSRVGATAGLSSSERTRDRYC